MTVKVIVVKGYEDTVLIKPPWLNYIAGVIAITVEPPIKDTPNKEHLSIKDKSTRPNSYYTSTF